MTLTHDELRAAAAVLDGYRAAGMTSLGAMVAAVNAINALREPARAADCADCQRPDRTCPGHVRTVML
ncbi:hypothetical protein SEA_LILPHARAOH_44 [Mycobacterium phage LilPharaoh]|uniref:hypothetical protein n=1 Tax=Mycobacterium phage Enkosi TaxID=1698709 RepID=UPI0006CE30B9|nr:hypothetical protein AVV01_gp46 [Mycobacterium phage Enkosi]ATN90497.1 hypothetical protein SEA_LILPHARAOH_44 [Mycobacterium phage LilPharaoh]AVP42621.1 hypothetical protein SEA_SGTBEANSPROUT_44 [Mycobacterium phage SgtBeansprout]AXC37150.1 hypothetical protein SEA_BIGLEBOPS_44 [Mycobacterium phage Biglebops]QGJ93329.1 hypothetical protein PBI_MDAVU_45 [Mycobacterium phage Mdavu]UQS94444.1 hypothetical protein SEA_NUTELLO_44 [Mycobacterium phage Nutello]UXE03207.1 hypothetical protein SEA_